MSGSSGKLVIISGPSGAGKSTVVEHLLANCDLPLELSISATTRAPRKNERHGIHYWFMTVEEFLQKRKDGDFLETCEVFGQGTLYGTPATPVTTGLKQGKWVILEIDVVGAKQAARAFPEAITIFVHPGGLDQLERRLRGRKSEPESAILRRLEVAREEMLHATWYQHTVINEAVETASREICRLLHTYE